MKNLIFSLIVTIFPSILFSQKFCEVPLQIKELKSSERLPKGEFEYYEADNFMVTGNIETCKGKMQLEIFSKLDTTLIAKGEFIESLDTLKHYVSDFIIGYDDAEKINVYSYFQPLKEGVWFYYDENGQLLRKEEYKRGIKISESKEE